MNANAAAEVDPRTDSIDCWNHSLEAFRDHNNGKKIMDFFFNPAKTRLFLDPSKLCPWLQYKARL